MNKTALNNARSKEQSFTVDYIRLYRQLPELWNVKCKDYHDRYKKKAGYETLLLKYREFYTEATMGDLKRKLNALRTNYRKEVKKYLTNKEHRPSLWYFGELCFLDNIDLSQDYDSSENTRFSIEYIEDDSVFETETISENPENHKLPRELASPKKFVNKNTNKGEQTQDILKKVKLRHESDRFSAPSKRFTQQSSTSEEHQIKDEYFHWAMACAADLRNMERTQQLYAKKAIAEILMEGQLGTLNRDSVKVCNQMDNSILLKIGSPQSPLYESNSLQNE